MLATVKASIRINVSGMRQAAAFFKALGDETRLQMLWLLLHHRELCVCDFMEVLEVSQSKASRHLRNLFHTGLVTDRRVGTWSYYTLVPSDDELVQTHMKALEQSLATRPELSELLERLSEWLTKKERGERACCA